MRRELDESWVAEAIAGHRRSEQLQAVLQAQLRAVEVSVRSPDELVEVLVGADGAIRRVTLAPAPPPHRDGAPAHRHGELSRALDSAVSAAGGAARWARRVVCAELIASAGLAEPHPSPGYQSAE